MGRWFLSILLASVMCLHLSMQGKIFLNTMVYRGTGPRTKTWHLSPLRFRGSISWTCFYVDPNVQMISNWAESLHDTWTQHILNIYCWNFSWTYAGGWTSMWKLHSCGTVASNLQGFPKKSQNSGCKIVSWFWACILPLFWMRVTFYHLEMIWAEVQANNEPEYNSYTALETIIDIPIIISYIIELLHYLHVVIGTVTTVLFLSELQLILFTSSLIQNLTFAEVFMTCHSITDGNQGYLRPGLWREKLLPIPTP